VWGVLEIVGLRVAYPLNCHDPSFLGGVDQAWAPGYDTCRNTYSECRAVTAVVMVWFGVRWWHNRGNVTWLPRGLLCDCLDAHLSTFILEVCGGAGALWGVSEVAKGPSGDSLRTGWGDAHFGQPSFDFWRIPAGITFALCFCRWWAVRVQGTEVVGAIHGTPYLSPKMGPTRDTSKSSGRRAGNDQGPPELTLDHDERTSV